MLVTGARTLPYASFRLRFTPRRAIVLKSMAFDGLAVCNLKCDLQSRPDSLNWPAFGRTPRGQNPGTAGVAKEVTR
jgi:hypothetical protein